MTQGRLGRLGLIGKKLGMTQVFAKGGELVPVTVIQAGPCTVVQKRTVGRDGYSALQLGFDEAKAQRLTKAAREHRKKAGKMPRVLREFPDAGAALGGGARARAQTLPGARVGAEENLLLVRGAVPGAENGPPFIRPAVKMREAA